MAEAMAPVPEDHPLMQAWKAHQASDEFRNSKQWVVVGSQTNHDEYVMGSLWALFVAGWQARGEAIAKLT